MKRVTTRSMVAEVRSMISESNKEVVADNDIVLALNRAQDKANETFSSQLQEPLLAFKMFNSSELTPVLGPNGQAQWAFWEFPEDVLSDRITKVEILPRTPLLTSTSVDVEQVSYRDLSRVTTTQLYQQGVDWKLYHFIEKKKLNIIPWPLISSVDFRVWYLREPDPLTLETALVTRIDGQRIFCVYSDSDAQFEVSADLMESYVNFVDGETGAIKGSFQIHEARVTGESVAVMLRESPMREQVLGRTILPASAMATLENPIAPDDYICPIDGTCIPYLKHPTSNFLKEFAANAMNKKLGVNAEADQYVVDRLEKQLNGIFAGREGTRRVKCNNPLMQGSRWRGRIN